VKRARGTGNTQYLKGLKTRARPWKYFKELLGQATEVNTVGRELAAACCPQSCGTAQHCDLPPGEQPPAGVFH
jgi:hypothetical protein